MDVRIKGPLDGIDLTHILRRRFEVQVIYLTAHVDEATAERALATQPLGYLSKPIRFAELAEVIGRAFALIAAPPA
jgi:DNA-binding NarL/FixJ family response regulator